jgi:hypothetical protein
MNRAPSISPATRDRLAHPAPPGQRHAQIVAIVAALIAEGFNGEAVFHQLRPNYGPDLPDTEIRGVIRWAENRASKISPAISPASISPRFCRVRNIPAHPKAATNVPSLSPVAAIELYLNGFRCEDADLWEKSPICLGETLSADSADLIAALYLPGENVNIVSAHAVSGTKMRPIGLGVNRTRENWLAEIAENGPPNGAGGVWIRPNPTNGRGVSDSDVAAHRFLLVEFGAIPLPLQLAFIARIPLPISAVIASGGKSLHTWVRVDAETATDYRALVSRIFAMLAPFGVDTANRNPSRLSRLPGVYRPSASGWDKRQRLLYLNPRSEPAGRIIA